MKHTLTYSALIIMVLAVFSSCKKTYTCYCYNDYRDVNDSTISRYHEDTRYEVRAVKRDYAEQECKYYQTHENYLQYEVYVEHYCEISDQD